MITCLIVSFIIFKILGKKNPFKRQQVKVPVCDKTPQKTI